MKWHIIILFVACMLVCECSNGGGVTGNPYAGGGVIGNPFESAFTHTDTVKSKLVSTTSNPFDPDSFYSILLKPSGAREAKVGYRQQYASSGGLSLQRFRLAEHGFEKITEWSPDSAVAYSWTKAGICTVQVQINTADTNLWSKPLIIDVVE